VGCHEVILAIESRTSSAIDLILVQRLNILVSPHYSHVMQKVERDEPWTGKGMAKWALWAGASSIGLRQRIYKEPKTLIVAA
jgi:hypothetical protein